MYQCEPTWYIWILVMLQWTGSLRCEASYNGRQGKSRYELHEGRRLHFCSTFDPETGAGCFRILQGSSLGGYRGRVKRWTE
jgi:hypothetical protein